MDHRLAASYRRCRRLHRAHGRTYFLATLLLPPRKWRHVHALYGFARYADEIVDALDGASPRRRAARLADLAARFQAGDLTDPVLPALLDTIERFDLDRTDFDKFLRSMAQDLTVSRYPTYADLLGYMEGSAAVIGTMMLPVLGSPHPGAAREPARQLGLAFQLTNFIRDVTEDLARDRVYLPQEDLRRFGVTEDDLRCGVTTPPIRQLVAHEVARARRHYALAAPGIALLTPAAQPCIRAAYRLYGGILDEIVAGGYDVLGQRATVPAGRRLRVAAGCLFARPGRPVPLPGVAADGRTSSRV
ncbi:MAG: 15-cis-phytoene synthase [Micromonosporaceae bacterium]